MRMLVLCGVLLVCIGGLGAVVLLQDSEASRAERSRAPVRGKTASGRIGGGAAIETAAALAGLGLEPGDVFRYSLRYEHGEETLAGELHVRVYERKQRRLVVGFSFAPLPGGTGLGDEVFLMVDASGQTHGGGQPGVWRDLVAIWRVVFPSTAAALSWEAWEIDRLGACRVRYERSAAGPPFLPVPPRRRTRASPGRVGVRGVR